MDACFADLPLHPTRQAFLSQIGAAHQAQMISHVIKVSMASCGNIWKHCTITGSPASNVTDVRCSFALILRSLAHLESGSCPAGVIASPGTFAGLLGSRCNRARQKEMTLCQKASQRIRSGDCADWRTKVDHRRIVRHILRLRLGLIINMLATMTAILQPGSGRPRDRQSTGSK